MKTKELASHLNQTSASGTSKKYKRFSGMEKRKNITVRAILIIITLMLLLFPWVSTLETHNVGASTGWDLRSNMEVWSATTTFNVGDLLVFLYNPSVHNVLEVHLSDYLHCKAAHPIRTYNNNGKAVTKLTQPGPRYFICGRQEHCKRGLRLQVQVLPLLSLDNNNDATTPTTISPSSSPATSPPSVATSAPPPYGAGEILHFGYVPVIMVLVMLVSCC